MSLPTYAMFWIRLRKSDEQCFGQLGALVRACVPRFRPISDDRKRELTYLFQLRILSNGDLFPNTLCSMEPRWFFKRKASDGELQCLSDTVDRVNLLILMRYCDYFRRVKRNDEIRTRTTERTRDRGIRLKPLFRGWRYFIELGVCPCNDSKNLLLKAYFTEVNRQFWMIKGGLLYVWKIMLSTKELIRSFLDRLGMTLRKDHYWIIGHH
jgi:hypothetical protein